MVGRARQCLKDEYDILSYQVEAVKEKYKHLLPRYNPTALLRKEMKDPSRIGHEGDPEYSEPQYYWN